MEKTTVRHYDAMPKSLKKGKKAEQYIAAIMTKAGALIIDGAKHADYDMKIKYHEKDWTLEIKDETRYSNSGNLCIEFAQGNPRRDSGIMISKADICIHLFDYMCSVFPRIEMVAYLNKMKKYGMIKSYIRGDNYNCQYYVKRANLALHLWYHECPTSEIAQCSIWNSDVT